MPLNDQQEPSATPPGAAFEPHFSVQQVSKMWGLGVDVIRRLFADQEGVIHITHPETLHKRSYQTSRISESALRRVHRKLTRTSGKVN